MEEDIKNDLAGIAYSHPFFSGIVENALNYIKELEEENKNFKKGIVRLKKKRRDLENEIIDVKVDKVTKNYIPISVIQNKIDEYEKAIEEEDYDNLRYSSIVETDMAIGVLKELLEERNK